MGNPSYLLLHGARTVSAFRDSTRQFSYQWFPLIRYTVNSRVKDRGVRQFRGFAENRGKEGGLTCLHREGGSGNEKAVSKDFFGDVDRWRRSMGRYAARSG